MVQAVQVEAANDAGSINRLIRALTGLGFDATAIEANFADGDDSPRIPVFRFSGAKSQGRLTGLVLKYYDESDDLDDQARDTRLLIRDRDSIDRKIEFDFELSFDGAGTLALLPRELFCDTPDLGRTIEQRYYAKLARFADFLERQRGQRRK